MSMPETSRPTRVKAWVRAVEAKHWAGTAGRWFRETMIAISRFGRSRLRLGQKIDQSYDASWARVEGALVGKDQADALSKWQDAENHRVGASLKRAMLDEKVAQEKIQTDKLRAEAAKAHADAEKTTAETDRVRAEAEKLRAETTRIRIEAAITMADRMAAAKVWVVRDTNGNFRLAPIPEGTDISPLYSELVSKELLDGLNITLGQIELSQDEQPPPVDF
jgi:hypothetical protein